MATLKMRLRIQIPISILSMMKLFTPKSWITIAKSSFLDVSQGSEYASADIIQFSSVLKQKVKSISSFQIYIIHALCNLVLFAQFEKTWKTTMEECLFLKVTLIYGCFSRFLNCPIGTKSCKASHILRCEITPYFHMFCFQNINCHIMRSIENLNEP